jgi:hypothetical protein
MTDASITCASVIHIAKLIHRVQQSEDANSRELASRVTQALQHPNRRIGAALQPTAPAPESEPARSPYARRADPRIRRFARPAVNAGAG